MLFLEKLNDFVIPNCDFVEIQCKVNDNSTYKYAHIQVAEKKCVF